MLKPRLLLLLAAVTFPVGCAHPSARPAPVATLDQKVQALTEIIRAEYQRIAPDFRQLTFYVTVAPADSNTNLTGSFPQSAGQPENHYYLVYGNDTIKKATLATVVEVVIPQAGGSRSRMVLLHWRNNAWAE